MIRILLFFVLIGLVTFSATWLADRPGDLVIVWQEWELRTSFAMALVLFVLLMGVLFYLYRFYIGLKHAPGLISEGFAGRRRKRGMNALAQGLIAVATGDVTQARKKTKQVSNLLDNEPLVQLLGAQTAQLEGNEEEVEKNFRAMLASPDTELMGLRGLLVQATRQNETEKALTYAKRAFELKPKTGWAYDALIELQCGLGRWTEALMTLEKGRKVGVAKGDPFKKQKAVLLTAKASREQTINEDELAEKDALQAHKLMPGLTPAALVAAKALIKREQMWKAAGVIEAAWRAAPHPALVDAYVALKPDETAHDRAKRLSGLAEMMPDHLESGLLLARQAINVRNWERAREVLAPFVDSTPNARVCTLMAEIERGEADNIGAAREWLSRAVAAPPESDWVRTNFDYEDQAWFDLLQDVGAEGVWPPEPDPALFDRAAKVVAPFTDELQVEEEVSPKVDVKDIPVIIEETPVATDYIVEEEQSVLRSKPAPRSKDKKISLSLAGADENALRSVKKDEPLLSKSKAKEERRQSNLYRQRYGKSTLALETAGGDSIFPRQPDDPGPDYSEEE